MCVKQATIIIIKKNWQCKAGSNNLVFICLGMLVCAALIVGTLHLQQNQHRLQLLPQPSDPLLPLSTKVTQLSKSQLYGKILLARESKGMKKIRCSQFSSKHEPLYMLETFRRLWAELQRADSHRRRSERRHSGMALDGCLAERWKHAVLWGSTFH